MGRNAQLVRQPERAAQQAVRHPAPAVAVRDAHGRDEQPRLGRTDVVQQAVSSGRGVSAASQQVRLLRLDPRPDVRR
ncbi:MAG TPA: hypothetical protein VF661_11580, partial [Actinomycetales bacterium]